MSKNTVKYFNPVKFSSIRQMMEQALEQVPEKIAYRFKEGSSIRDVSYSEFIETVYSLGAFLSSIDADSAGISCIGQNSYDWLTVFFTGLRSKGFFVPIDCQLPAKDAVNILTESEAKVVFCSQKCEAMLLESGALPETLKYIICFERAEDDGMCLSYQKALAKGRELDKSAFLDFEKDVNELKLLVYTSGTTGMAKGVMLSENNLVSDVYYGLKVTTVHEVGLSVLPYHHTYEAVTDILVSFHKHSTICINDSMMNVLKNLNVYKPDYLFIVPGIAELFYTRIMRSLKKDGKDKDFEKLVSKSSAARKFGIDIRPEVFAQIREIFGGNLKKIVCGGAAVRPTVAKFFDDIGITFLVGYGITECSPLVAVNNDFANDYNTAGIRLPCIDLRISLPDEDGIGEVCVKGPIVMLGYYKHPELTAEVMRKGWFYTGDYGYINEDGYLILCGRKKNVIVLNNGKNIYPEEIEGYIQDIDYVSEVIVSSETDNNGNETSLTAEVFLSEVKTAPEVLKSIKAVCTGLPVYKQISKVVIRDNEFEKTSTNKIKRFINSKRKPKTEKETPDEIADTEQNENL